MLPPFTRTKREGTSRPGREEVSSCPYKEMEGARGPRPHLEGTNYRALERDWAAQVESVDGAGGVTGVVEDRAAGCEIRRASTQGDRGSLRQRAAILDGKPPFVAPTEHSAQQNDLRYVRARTERARGGRGECRVCSQVLAQPKDVGPGRDSHRKKWTSISRGRGEIEAKVTPRM